MDVELMLIARIACFFALVCFLGGGGGGWVMVLMDERKKGQGVCGFLGGVWMDDGITSKDVRTTTGQPRANQPPINQQRHKFSGNTAISTSKRRQQDIHFHLILDDH
jgi:hypothetical protein